MYTIYYRNYIYTDTRNGQVESILATCSSKKETIMSILHKCRKG